MSTPPEEQPSLLYLVKQVELAVRAELDQLVRPHGVTVVQYTALTVLERRAGLTAAELARRSFVTTQSIADVVSGLERRGLIARRADEGDRRRALIDLTDQGRAVLDELGDVVAALERRMVAGLTASAEQRLRQSLGRCRTALEA